MNNLITCLIVCVLSCTAFAETWTVDDDGKADFDNIQDAIDAASDGDEIIVAPGTYTSTNSEVVDMLGKAVILRSSNPSDPDVVAATIIDGENIRRGILCNNSETIKTIIEGFTITNGNAGSGGGMYNSYSDPTLRDCTFDNNAATGGGGGMYNNQSNPTLTNCIFANCNSNIGGGMANDYNSSPTLTNCTFTDNIALDGGGGMANYYYNSSPSLTDCTFISNYTGSSGGGMYNEYSSSPTLTNCTLSLNIAGNAGGGMYNSYSDLTLTNCALFANNASRGGGMYNENGSPSLTDCTFTGNTAILSGGGIANKYSNPGLTNCTFTGNNAFQGGGMYNDESSLSLTNCTLTGNTAIYYGGGMFNIDCSPAMIDTTVCGNTPDQLAGDWTDNGGNIIVDLCPSDEDKDGIDDSVDNCYLYNPDQADCNGNGIGDVCDFADGTSFDCNSNLIPDECDIADGNSVDCNANGVPDDCDIANGTSHDWNGNDIPDDCECLADINADGIVNVNDLLIVIGNWDSSGIGDINLDGSVDVSDLLYVVGNWGPCLPSGCTGNGLVDEYTATAASPCMGTTIPASDISFALSLNSNCSVTGTADVFGTTMNTTPTTWSYNSTTLTIGSFSGTVAEDATSFTTPLELIFPAVADAIEASLDLLPPPEIQDIIDNCGSVAAYVAELEMTWSR